MPAEHMDLTAHIVTGARPVPVTVPTRAKRLARSEWRSNMLRGANWRWLAPAGAIAAMLLLWIAFHEGRPSSFEMAKNTQPASSPAPSPVPQQSIAPPRESTDSLRRESETSNAAARPESRSLSNEEARRKLPGVLEEKKSADAAKHVALPPVV